MLKAPFTWFGGKSRVAEDVWERLGDVPNYVEPFAGSLAVPLARPHAPKVETFNDRNCYLVNFWRAVSADADAVAGWCDWPVIEVDLHVRHAWLLARAESLRALVSEDPAAFDAQAAGWWVWGAGLWIGDGWCAGKLHRKMPELSSSRGIHRTELGFPSVREYLVALAKRLRAARILCGDWRRVLGDSVTRRHGTTGVFLDPPYPDGARGLYGPSDERATWYAAADWAAEHGSHPDLRVALCGYEGTWESPTGWHEFAWKARGGYAGQGEDENINARRERIWFSPHCLTSRQHTLFGHLLGGTAA